MQAPILAPAFEMLHFQAFMETIRQDMELPINKLIPILSRLQENTDAGTWDEILRI